MEDAPLPKSVLGYHRIMSPSGGLRVSPLCLGTMNFGEAWAGFMGECGKEQCFAILDYFYAQGGNFIDTANLYQNEESEIWLGEWFASRGNRDEIVLATKFASGYKAGSDPKRLQSNFHGNHTKSLHLSVAASLKKLQTDYLDILYVHWWDFSTSIPELMQSLNVLIQQGKVLYLGISDTPAWIVAKANQYARDHGLRPFSIYQGQWSAANRDFERDILPMCAAEEMAIAPWGALGGGAFKSEEQRKATEGRKTQVSDKDVAVSKVLETIATRKDTAITSVALAYVMHKAPNVYPIVGGRNIEHLKGNIEALKLKLDDKDVEEIEAAVPFDYGFPLTFLFREKPSLQTKDVWLVKTNAHLDVLPHQSIISPRSE